MVEKIIGVLLVVFGFLIVMNLVNVIVEWMLRYILWFVMIG